jgi:hypothetical protein
MITYRAVVDLNGKYRYVEEDEQWIPVQESRMIVDDMLAVVAMWILLHTNHPRWGGFLLDARFDGKWYLIPRE